MKLLYYTLFFGMLAFVTTATAQKVVVYDKYDSMEKALIKDNSTIYIINFWATWCAPCIKELPYFEKLHIENKQVKLILVSLDSKKDLESKLIPFLKKKNITSEVVLLSDKDYNTWLTKVDENWSGAIPATWIVRGNQKVFTEREFENFTALNDYVNSFINLNK